MQNKFGFVYKNAFVSIMCLWSILLYNFQPQWKTEKN